MLRIRWVTRSRSRSLAMAMTLVRCPRAPPRYRAGQLVQHRNGGVPTQAGVGDALPAGERAAGLQVLPPLDQVALDHHADDLGAAAGHLVRHRARHLGLAAEVL